MNFAYDKLVGERIREERELKGMTQEELAAQLQTKGCDVTRSALAKMEVGQRHIYTDEIRHIKDILKVSFDVLFPRL